MKPFHLCFMSLYIEGCKAKSLNIVCLRLVLSKCYRLIWEQWLPKVYYACNFDFTTADITYKSHYTGLS